ncbi:MAG: response regulator transcription factor [Deltaproteobacteria bacterium]|nr:response regulator transcription factor [Deltaproteobacteria bacterium]
MTAKILLIEDDEKLGAQVVRHLEREHYDTEWWTEDRGIDEGCASRLNLLILDLMLPGASGFEILEDVRRISDVPVLVLSARSETNYKVRALKLGADDYVTKPFWPEELIQRVDARLRRPTLHKQHEFDWGDLKLDLAGRRVLVRGEPVDLTRIEFNLLVQMARRPGTAVTRQHLLEVVLDPDRESTERAVDVHVSRLRKKLGMDNLIETVWGIGYRLRVGPSR